MTNVRTEKGAVLLTSLMLAVLLSLLGTVAINFAMTETEASRRQLKESSARLLAESGVEQVIVWFNQGKLPGDERTNLPAVFKGTASTPDVSYDAVRPEDDHLLNDAEAGIFRTLGEFGRIEHIRLYGSTRPEGLCTVEVTSRSKHGVGRSMSLELGATRIAPLHVAIQTGARTSSDGTVTPRLLAHWGTVRIAGNARLGPSDQIPRKYSGAAVSGQGYGEAGTAREDRWSEIYIGGTAQFDDADRAFPSNVHPNQDPFPGLPADPWQYHKFKQLAMKSGSYYVADRAGLLYRDGVMDPAMAQTPDEVFGNGGLPAGLIFVDTLDRAAPSADNLPTITVTSPYIEGMFFINAHLTLAPESPGKTIAALSPPSEGTTDAASRIPVSISGVAVQGVLHTTGTLHTDRAIRIYGSLVAERGLTGAGLLETWYNYDAERGLFQGLSVVFPLAGSWREWGS
ncbi:MAG TPA: hypothetical protein VGJ57_04615 [Nitrospirales bacterium]|jgi:hypothetical protein